jgi:hypothetical protein
MFFELAEVPGGLTDPAVRAEISSRYDSIPGQHIGSWYVVSRIGKVPSKI